MSVQYSKQAVKFLQKQTKQVQQRIISAINKLPAGDVKRMQGSKLYRLRVGDFRILFSRTGEVLFIERIGNRGEIYKD